MLKHKRLVSIIATIAFCLSFLAPALLAPAPAVAATTLIQLSAPTITTPAPAGQLGRVALDIEELAAVQVNDVFTVSLPTEAQFATGLGATSVGVDNAAQDVNVITTADLNNDATAELAGFTFVASPNNPNSFDVRVTAVPAGASGKGRLIVDFRNMIVQSYDQDVNATFLSPSSWFTAGKVVIAKTTTSRSGLATCSSVNSGTATVTPDTIVLIENSPNAFRTGDVFTLTIPSGYRWTTAPHAVGGWGLSNAANDSRVALPGNGIAVSAPYDDGRKIDVSLTTAFVASSTIAGRISVGFAGNFAVITPDETIARPGEVSVDISTSNPTLAAVTIAPSTLPYFKYVEFGITMEAASSEELIGGKNDVRAGTLVIEEGAANSIVPNRTINLTLPNGVRWHQTDAAAPVTTFPTITTQKGTAVPWTIADVGSDARVIRLTPGAGSTSAMKVELSNLRFDVSPAFSGPIEIEVSGTQGITGKYKVAEVVAPLKIETDETTKVSIGAAGQALPDIFISENKKDTIRSTQRTVSGVAPNGNQAQLAIVLPPGVTFTNTPAVSVTEGDLGLDISGAFKTNVFNGILRGAYIIPIRAASVTPSTIKVSDVKVTVDRTVAEGPLTIGVDSVDQHDAVDENYWTTGGFHGLFTYEGYVSAAVANCVTPASTDQGRNASFYIGSTIMNVNGSNIIMDAAPYIKAGRTYVPVRYLGDALGATTAWDEATKTVTVTKGDKTVVLVIGSTIAKVNGADVQMDVAPEITGVGRTMLPARWVAEGLGYQVGWNAALQQVVIQ